MVDIVAAEAGAYQLLEQVGLLIAALGRTEAGQRIVAMPVLEPLELAGSQGKRLFPGRFAEYFVQPIRIHHEIT